MEKYLKYYPSDLEYVIPNNHPVISYCKLEDEIHYQNIPK